MCRSSHRVAKIFPATRKEGRPWWPCSAVAGRERASWRASSAFTRIRLRRSHSIHPGRTRPLSYASTTSCARSRTPSLTIARLTCVFAVATLSTLTPASQRLGRSAHHQQPGGNRQSSQHRRQARVTEPGRQPQIHRPHRHECRSGRRLLPLFFLLRFLLWPYRPWHRRGFVLRDHETARL
jgi:hypothetical protein